jgi:hypothetical protein
MEQGMPQMPTRDAGAPGRLQLRTQFRTCLDKRGSVVIGHVSLEKSSKNEFNAKAFGNGPEGEALDMGGGIGGTDCRRDCARNFGHSTRLVTFDR